MRIVVTKQFKKNFSKQPDRIKKEFARRINILQKDMRDPLLRLHKLSGKLNGLWSINISGDVRVVFDRPEVHIIVLIAIGSHSELYS